ncbi:MAG: hypothetical protein GXO75_06485 [Calditrichaeota bacterium]|nr:hypothetical protein [Calditrichota bacterium]
MVNYKFFLKLFLLIFLMTTQIQGKQPDEPIQLNKGPHLFIDNYLVAEQSFLTRTVNNPKKLPDPIITGGKDGDDNFQPYLSVIRDPKSGRFRIWYNTAENMRQSHIGYMESEDGIHWIRPHRVLKDPHKIRFGCTVLDRGIDFPDPQKRFVLAFYHKDGMMLAVSPNGLEWKMLADTSVLKHNHDINSLHWDPIRQQYLAVFSNRAESDYWQGRRRIPYESVSKDLIHWEKPWMIITPKIGAPIEQGETQFYAMSGVIRRGDLLIGLVKILRDDLNATPGKTAKEMGDMKRKAAGLGYTVLAWTRDGRTWQRDYEPFLRNNPLPGSWDHAMAWGDEQIIVGNETFIYYVGYARGHKVARFKERQIGLARMPRDRYVSLDADLNVGILRTKPVVLNAESMTINANVPGMLRVRLLDENGKPLSDFDWFEIKGDSIAHPVKWKGNLKSLAGKTMQIEFQLRYAQLFGFDLW